MKPWNNTIDSEYEEQWRAVECPYCHAAADTSCIAVAVSLNGAQDRVPPGEPRPRPHPSRVALGAKVEFTKRRAEWFASPEAAALRAKSAEADRVRAEQRMADQDRRDADSKRTTMRDSKRASGGYNWSEEDERGKKRQRLVQWLMMKPRCLPLEKAKLIAWRKYQ